MFIEADQIIDGLGGTTAVARLVQTPVSTVHSWRRIGIPQSRMAHLRLAADAEGLEWPVADHDASDTAECEQLSPGKRSKNCPSQAGAA